MFELLLPVGLFAAFGTVMAGGVAVESSRRARREAMRMLEAAKVADVPMDQREQELAQPFAERVVRPIVSVVGKIARRVTPIDMRKRIEKKLVLAGNPPKWDAEKVAAFKVIGFFAGAFVAFSVTRVVHVSGMLSLAAIVLFGFLGYLMPGAMLGQKAAGRQEALRKALPDTMDLLTISVEAGLGFDAALAQVIHNVPGPLSDEISRLLQEMQLGVSRVDAFRSLADRTSVEELRGFVLAMIQADIFGVSISGVLRAQAKDLRVKRRQRAERKAMTSPLKLLFPLIFCVLPALFVVVLGPGAIRILHNFFGIGN
jgi:tight adherence protein C